MERRTGIQQNPNFALLFLAAGLFTPSLINPVTAALIAAGAHLGVETFKK